MTAQLAAATEHPEGEPKGGGQATRQDALQTLIDLEVLSQQAKAEKIEVKPEEVDAQLMEIKAQFASPEAFDQALAASNANETEMKKDIERRLLIQKLIEHNVKTDLPPGAVENYYASNIEQFKHPEEVRASHILFRATADHDRATVKKRAESTLKRIQKGEDFEKVALELSRDPDSIQNNGDLG